LAIITCVPLAAVFGIIGVALDKKKWLAATAGGASALLVLWYSYMVITH